jgi:hypothetical protein
MDMSFGACNVRNMYGAGSLKVVAKGLSKIDLREREDGIVWTGSIWLRMGTSGGLL